MRIVGKDCDIAVSALKSDDDGRNYNILVVDDDPGHPPE
jgi:hypothetical protein